MDFDCDFDYEPYHDDLHEFELNQLALDNELGDEEEVDTSWDYESEEEKKFSRVIEDPFAIFGM